MPSNERLDVFGSRVAPAPLTRCSAHGFKHGLFKPIAHGANVAFSFREILESELGRFSETNNRRDIFRPAAATIFLAATSDQWTEAGLPADIKRADAFRAVKFVRGKGKEIDRRIAQAHRDFAGCLYGVCMKQHAFLATDFGNFLDGKYHAGFVVCPHD